LGIKADLAISSTLSHPVDMDFPTLSSGNHVICVVELNGAYIFLDATESAGVFGYPSRQIQGRQVMLSQAGGAKYIKVPIVSVEENKCISKYTVNIGGELNGSGIYTVEHHGYSALPIRTLMYSTSEENVQNRFRAYMENKTEGLKFSNLRLDEHSDPGSIKISCELETTLKSRKLNNKTYLQLGLIEMPFSTMSSRSKKVRSVTYSTINKMTEIHLKFDQAVSLLSEKDTTFNANDISFNWKIEQTDKDHIMVYYHYVNNNIEMNSEQLDSMFELSELIEELFNSTLIYETDPETSN